VRELVQHLGNGHDGILLVVTHLVVDLEPRVGVRAKIPASASASPLEASRSPMLNLPQDYSELCDVRLAVQASPACRPVGREIPKYVQRCSTSTASTPLTV
jgi:hypothetical protein